MFMLTFEATGIQGEIETQVPPTLEEFGDGSAPFSPFGTSSLTGDVDPADPR